MKMVRYEKGDLGNLDMLLGRAEALSKKVREAEKIVDYVKKEGVQAVAELTERFDGVRICELEVGEEEIEEAYKKCSKKDLEAIRVAKRRIERFQKLQKDGIRDTTLATGEGLSELKWLPIRRVGVYAPAGNAPLVSSVLMGVVPAKVAGAQEVVLCTPPQKDGLANPFILVAAREAGADRVLKIGGAQAIAAMGYGLECLEPVQLIVGPGNAYVTAAKQILAARGVVKIDMPAGPSEVVVIADENANERVVASSMLAQAEHGEDSRSICITTSEEFAERLSARLGKFSDRMIVVLVSSMEEALEISNEYAPEHLEIFSEDWREILKGVVNAGAVFINTGTVYGDYGITGCNHILPTGGSAKSYSGLSIMTFMRGIFIQKLEDKARKKFARIAARLARIEGLEEHAKAAEIGGKYGDV
ncbi:histidinol dehydrogenase [Candidatus Micrarchaeota archaeon]|nr:histidinol dehydrogenase [Candidatus Micrarchaeota archaeon]